MNKPKAFIECKWKKRRPFYYTLQARDIILGSVLSINTKEWFSMVSRGDYSQDSHQSKEEAMKAVEDYYSPTIESTNKE